MSDAMDAEFDTVASWTGHVAADLGPDYYLPAGCRGSGRPATLRWLLDHLSVSRASRMLDCGAGVGGPAGFAAAHTGVRPVLTDPEPGACRAARRLFSFPVVQAGSELPFRTGSFDVAWSLGVLCTVDRQGELLTELRRVLGPDGRLGLLVFVAEQSPVPDPPEGNHFPTPDDLETLLTEVRFTIEAIEHEPTASDPPTWAARTEVVETELERRHGDDPAWRTAVAQSSRIGQLLSDGVLAARMLIARATA